MTSSEYNVLTACISMVRTGMGIHWTGVYGTEPWSGVLKCLYLTEHYILQIRVESNSESKWF